jgi:hypothetical protein
MHECALLSAAGCRRCWVRVANDDGGAEVGKTGVANWVVQSRGLGAVPPSKQIISDPGGCGGRAGGSRDEEGLPEEDSDAREMSGA